MEQDTRQDELIEKAFEVADEHQPDGRNHYGYDQCNCGWVAQGGTERWADHLVHLLAVEGLLADAERSDAFAELEDAFATVCAERDLAVWLHAEAQHRAEELADFAGEQANARRESDRVRNIAAREAADLRDERNTALAQLAEKTEYAGEKAREGDVMSLQIDDLTAERNERQNRLVAVLAVCAQGEWQATRWEQPFPVPTWVTDVRAAAQGGQPGGQADRG